MESLSALKNKNPLQILKKWLKEAKKLEETDHANAMVLSSCSKQTNHQVRLSSRVVLLKEIKKEELIFYTNYNSLKGQQIQNPVALNFYWPALGRQVRLEGRTKKISRKSSIRYWKTRPYESKLSQYISKQSSTLENRNSLEQQWQEAKKKFQKKTIPCPVHWGGVAFSPKRIEFWVEKPHRLHDRLLFIKSRSKTAKKIWKTQLLYP